MERITTDKPTAEMTMLELAHNSCYVKDRNTMYRDYERDVDARQLIIGLLDKYADTPNEFTSDEDFDDFMLESLYEDTGSMTGVLAILYTQIWAKAELWAALKRYEDLKDGGRMIEMPFVIGDTVYCIEINGEIIECAVRGVNYRNENGKIHLTAGLYEGDKFWGIRLQTDIGKTVFFTKEEAEVALEKRLEERV